MRFVFDLRSDCAFEDSSFPNVLNRPQAADNAGESATRLKHVSMKTRGGPPDTAVTFAVRHGVIP
jgi:hypothetical protein